MANFARTKIDIFGSMFPAGDVHVKKIVGHEKISNLFEFRVQIFVTNKELGLRAQDLQAHSVSLIAYNDDGVLRRIHGMIASVEESFEVSLDYEQYDLLIVPHMWQLTTIKLQNVYVNKSVPDLIRHKLERAGLGGEGEDYELHLHENDYPKIPFIIQYQESDFDFISRITEDAGISFYFTHTQNDEEEQIDKVVFCDANVAFPLVLGASSVPFERTGQKVGLYELGLRSDFAPGLVWVRDYNYRQPGVPLEQSITVAKANDPDSQIGRMGMLVEYGNHFETPADGDRLVQIRAQEAQCDQLVYRGSSDLIGFGAGSCFSIDNFSKVDEQLLLVEVHHEFTQTITAHDGEGEDRFYQNRFHAIPSARTYRPPRTTPVPKMVGVMTGFIVAEGLSCRDTLPSSAAADIDNEGRYLVEFHLDTPGNKETVPSIRIRMAQPSSGTGYGMHLPLRPGTEVAIAFVNGDVRRPMIIGAVHNALAPNLVTAQDATKARIRSQTGLLIEFCDSPEIAATSQSETSADDTAASPNEASGNGAAPS